MTVYHRPLPSQSVLDDAVIYDALTGHLSWRRSRSGIRQEQPAGWVSGCGAKYITIDGISYLQCRVIWKLVTVEDPPDQIDHMNRDETDNAWSNLRTADNSLNSLNRNLQRNNSSGFRGISSAGGGWYRVRLNTGGQRIHLGYYRDIEKAVEVRREAEIKHYGVSYT